jgi:hypothetical protein
MHRVPKAVIAMREILNEENQMREIFDKKVHQLSLDFKQYFETKEQEGLFDVGEVIYLVQNTPEDELTDTELSLLESVNAIHDLKADIEQMDKLNTIRIFKLQTSFGKAYLTLRDPSLGGAQSGAEEKIRPVHE